MVSLAPNQNAVRIVKAPADKDHLYGVYNRAAMENAMKKLSPSGFKFWCYLGMNQDGYEFGLSFINVHECCGLGRSTYYSTVKELEEKGFLIKIQLYKRLPGYLFVETGEFKEEMAVLRENRYFDEEVETIQFCGELF